MESDERLFERMSGGEMEAFDALYQRYERRLFGFIRAYLSDGAEAEDVFHETFLALLSSGPPVAASGSVRAWLYQVARNRSLNRLRSRRRGDAAEEQIAVAAAPLPESAPEKIERREVTAALADAVQRLPNALSELYRLRAQGMSYQEMSAVLELPLGTVKSRMHEMVNQLRKEMEPWTAD